MSNLENKIESYLSGILTGSELVEFENELKNNQELTNLVDQQRAMINKLEAYRIRTKVKSALAANSRPKVVLTQKAYIGIAASLLIFTISIWYYMTRTDLYEKGQFAQEEKLQDQQGSDSLVINNKILETDDHVAIIESPVKENTEEELLQRRKMASLYLVLPMLIQVRESEDLDSSLIENQSERAKVAFKNQNYNVVISLLGKVKNPMNDEEILFIRAISYFKLSMFDKAAIDFSALKNSFQFKAEADFNAMLCLLALNKLDSTKQILNSMISDKDFQFRTQAIEIKTKINFE